MPPSRVLLGAPPFHRVMIPVAVVGESSPAGRGARFGRPWSGRGVRGRVVARRTGIGEILPWRRAGEKENRLVGPVPAMAGNGEGGMDAVASLCPFGLSFGLAFGPSSSCGLRRGKHKRPTEFPSAHAPGFCGPVVSTGTRSGKPVRRFGPAAHSFIRHWPRAPLQPVPGTEPRLSPRLPEPAPLPPARISFPSDRRYGRIPLMPARSPEIPAMPGRPQFSEIDLFQATKGEDRDFRRVPHR